MSLAELLTRFFAPYKRMQQTNKTKKQMCKTNCKQTNKQNKKLSIQDGRILPGDRIMFVNSSQLQHASLDTAVQVEQQDGNEDDYYYDLRVTSRKLCSLYFSLWNLQCGCQMLTFFTGFILTNDNPENLKIIHEECCCNLFA